MKIFAIVCVSFLLVSVLAAGPTRKTAKHSIVAPTIAVSPKTVGKISTTSIHVNHPAREEFDFCTKEIKDNVKALRDLFYKGDTNKDGVLSREEYLVIAQEVFNVGRKHPFSEEQCERWFDALDMNGDGVLTQREFIPLSAVASSFFDDAYMATHSGHN